MNFSAFCFFLKFYLMEFLLFSVAGFPSWFWFLFYASGCIKQAVSLINNFVTWLFAFFSTTCFVLFQDHSSATSSTRIKQNPDIMDQGNWCYGGGCWGLNFALWWLLWPSKMGWPLRFCSPRRPVDTLEKFKLFWRNTERHKSTQHKNTHISTQL